MVEALRTGLRRGPRWTSGAEPRQDVRNYKCVIVKVSVPLRTFFTAAVLLVTLAGCQKMPETYAPPEQRPVFENFRPYRISRIVEMSDGDVDAHIVRDLPTGQSGPWRWTGANPTVKVVPRTAENLHYVLDFSIADSTFKDTGPVTLQFFVGEQALDSARYTAAGSYHFEKALPDGWVEAGKEVTIGASIDKMWTSPVDGAKLGFILTRIGLRQGASK